MRVLALSVFRCRQPLPAARRYLDHCDAASKSVSGCVEKVAQAIGSAVGSRALLGENLMEFVHLEKNETVYTALHQITMKLDGLSANSLEHAPTIREASSTMGCVREQVKATKKSLLVPYVKAEKLLRSTLVKRSQAKAKQWKTPTLWPPGSWNQAQDGDNAAAELKVRPPQQVEKTLDKLATDFRVSFARPLWMISTSPRRCAYRLRRAPPCRCSSGGVQRQLSARQCEVGTELYTLPCLVLALSVR
jgi:hypothetical protein